MGNLLDSVPTRFSDQTDGLKTETFGNQDSSSYMAAYRQNSTTADSMSYGDGRLQFGVKIIQDIDPGPNQNQLYVVNNAGKRLYITNDGQLAPYASQYLMSGKNYGNGPAVSITGNPLHPQYHMWYAQGGDEHGASGDWTPININSKQDIMEAMRSGMKGMDYNGKHSNMWGQASINPFGAKEGGDVWTGAARFDDAIDGVVSQLVIPVAESFMPGPIGAALDALGVNKALQSGLDSLIKNTQGKTYQGSTSFDPQISNILKDPRLPGFLQQQEDQAHSYVVKYGPSAYVATQKLAQDTPSQQIQKAQQLQQENYDHYTEGQVQEITDLSSKLQSILEQQGTQLTAQQAQVFSDIKLGLSQPGRSNQQKLNIISHFGTQLQQQVLPLLKASSPSTTPSSPSVPEKPVSSNGLTSSAQVGHPSLSINGTHTTNPGKTVITGNPPAPVPVPVL